MVEPRPRSQGAWFCSSLGLLEETDGTSPRPRGAVRDSNHTASFKLGQDAPRAVKTLRTVTSRTGQLVGSTAPSGDKVDGDPAHGLVILDFPLAQCDPEQIVSPL